MAELRLQALFDLIYIADASGVKSIAVGDFNVRCCNPKTGETALQAVIISLIRNPRSSKDTLEAAAWLLKQGADPDQAGELKPYKGKPSKKWEFKWKLENGHGQEENETVVISFSCATHSALSLLALLMKKMHKKRIAAWEHYCRNLRSMLDILMNSTERAQVSKVGIDSTVLDLWDTIRSDSGTHDVTLRAADAASVTAHSHVLSRASPVVAAMLSSAMGEASSKEIQLDCSGDSINFMLDLIYMGTSSAPFTCGVALPALDLAHRWQIHGVVQMLQRAACGALTQETFAEIAEAALLKGLEELKHSCETFAHHHATVIGERQHTMPAIVREWLVSKRHSSSSHHAAKKQRVAY